MDMAPTIAAETGAAKAVGLATWLGARGRERVLGTPDFEPSGFLELGLAVGRAVCLVEVKDRLGGSLVRGTGFLVAPGVVVTNHHVIMNAEEARDTTLTFDFRNDPYGRAMPTTVFALAPERLFVSDADLDCTFVAVGPRISGAQNADEFGWFPLVGAEGKVEVGDPVNIIQHPRGEPMQFVLRGNKLLLLPELAEYRDPKVFAHYEADTLPGSSGAPVSSRLWEVIALHHQAVPAINANGDVVDVDGQPYAGSDETRVKWLGNEGIRVSALVRFLESQRPLLRGTQGQALDSVLAAARPDYIALAVRSHQAAGTALPESLALGGIDMSGRIEFTLPIKISISLGQLSLPAAVSTPTAPGAASGAQARVQPDVAPRRDSGTPLPAGLKKEHDEALQELERSRTRTYFDAPKDATDRAGYYRGIVMGADEDANFEALTSLVDGTHATKVRYAPAKQVYPWVDLHKDGRRLVIKSVYSGQVFDAKDFIEEAFRIEGRRESLRVSMRRNESFGNVPEAVLEDLLEANAPFNCEHVVPQSWFSKKEPMRGDLHHLFSCESRCNSFRGNHAYFDFPPDEAVMDLCGRREEDQFEPGAGKGAVARATFYFLVRYPAGIDLGISQMDESRLATLLEWHRGDPVSDHERHRNQAIFAVQGNRNPFIDNPDWAEKVALAKGLG
jgi:endonuclease I/V8-like Glu-specific endopeptidase